MFKHIDVKKCRNLSDIDKLCIIGTLILQWLMVFLFMLLLCIDWDMTLNNLGY